MPEVELTLEEKIEKIQKRFHDRYLVLQDERDAALRRLEKARGKLYPQERATLMFHYDNPRLKVEYEKPMDEAETALREFYREYYPRQSRMYTKSEEEILSDLRHHADRCLLELKDERDGANFEAIRWEMYNKAKQEQLAEDKTTEEQEIEEWEAWAAENLF